MLVAQPLWRIQYIHIGDSIQRADGRGRRGQEGAGGPDQAGDVLTGRVGLFDWEARQISRGEIEAHCDMQKISSPQGERKRQPLA